MYSGPGRSYCESEGNPEEIPESCFSGGRNCICRHGALPFASSMTSGKISLRWPVQAASGLLAILVLLVVMNWFFHRLYWTGWISLDNHRKGKMPREEGKAVGRCPLPLECRCLVLRRSIGRDLRLCCSSRVTGSSQVTRLSYAAWS